MSDTMAILNKGELLAQAQIEELLACSGGITYRVNLRGVTEEIRTRVQAQPWVTALTEQTVNSHLSWSISVSDEAAAENQLLRMVLADSTVTVAEFGRQTYDLEEVFLRIVEGGKNGK